MAIEEIKSLGQVEQNAIKEVKNIYPKTEPYPDDTVEISNKKKTKKSKLNKLVTGFGITVAAFWGTVFILMSREKHHLKKLYKEKLVLSNLPEKIEFRAAKTIEEGIKYAKETLGIKEIDKNFTLEALNTANKGITDVSNAHKGKVFIPKRLRYQELTKDGEQNYVAYVIRNVNSNDFGDIIINKRYFDEKFLDKEISDLLFYKDGKPLYEMDSLTNKLIGYYKQGCVYPQIKGDLEKLVKKYYKNKTDLSIDEKQTLMYSMWNVSNDAGRTFRSPLETLKNISKNKAAFLKANHININFAEIEKMTTEKQVEYLKDIIKKFEEKGKYIDVYYDISSPASTIHHEMGHLQDFAKNLKELDMKRYINWSEIWERAKNKTKTGEDIRRVGVKELDNRWGSIEDKYYKNLFENNPEKFKKWYPELYEFLTNQEIQQTAGKVSWYAQSGIGEFIAETYANMIGGKALPEDVMALYRKYKGPELI